jgi:hypothetical protein
MTDEEKRFRAEHANLLESELRANLEAGNWSGERREFARRMLDDMVLEHAKAPLAEQTAIARSAKNAAWVAAIFAAIAALAALVALVN